MPIGQMRQTIFSDSNFSLFQQAINDQFSALGKIPFINGVLIKDQALVTGQANVINHKLGQTATGYLIFLNSNESTIWNDPIVDDKGISLKCSVSTTVTLWVF